MITIINSIMGSGKTSFMVNYVNTTYKEYLGSVFDDGPLEAPKFIYVAPLLSEVDRITNACPDLDFRNPQPVEGRKLHHLETLVEQGANICTTHALFKSITKSISEKIKEQNYTLVIDEALDCVTIFDELTKSDREIIFRDNLVYVEEGTNRVRWNHKDHKSYSGKFDAIRNLCDNGNLILYRDTVMLWEFPTEFIKSFDEVFVLTYLFQGSPMSAYLRAEGLEHQIKTLNRGDLVPWTSGYNETVHKADLRKLITIYEGPLNDCGKSVQRSHPFSVGWLNKQHPERLKKVKATTEYFFKSVASTPSTDNAWTTFSPGKKHLAGAGYSRGFISSNAKATNDYKHKKTLAYMCNVFYNPYIRGYFEDRGIKVHEDAYALSEMIQWIWRSQIREGKPITVFIPSERMRRLLSEWLEGSTLNEVSDEISEPDEGETDGEDRLAA
jgi:hypothetical protein